MAGDKAQQSAMADLAPAAEMLLTHAQEAMLPIPNHAPTAQGTAAQCAATTTAAEIILLHLLQGAAHLPEAAASAVLHAAAGAALAAEGPVAEVAVAHAVAEAAEEDKQ